MLVLPAQAFIRFFMCTSHCFASREPLHFRGANWILSSQADHTLISPQPLHLPAPNDWPLLWRICIAEIEPQRTLHPKLKDP